MDKILTAIKQPGGIETGAFVSIVRSARFTLREKPTLFPTGGLPSWIKNSALNGKALTEAEHAAAHQALADAERVARGMGLANPLGTAGRLGADTYRNSGGGCN